MSEARKPVILIVEDEPGIVARYRHCTNGTADLAIVGTTEAALLHFREGGIDAVVLHVGPRQVFSCGLFYIMRGSGFTGPFLVTSDSLTDLALARYIGCELHERDPAKVIPRVLALLKSIVTSV